jgi:hypothetical protein
MTKLFFVLLLVSVSLSAHTQNQNSDSAKLGGKVYFLRSTGYNGSAQGFTVFIDDEIVCKLNNKRFSIHEVAAGNHKFSVQFAGKSSKEKAERIEISVEPGKTYYIQLIFQTGLLKNNLYCQEVTENSAKTMMNKLTEDTKCL